MAAKKDGDVVVLLGDDDLMSFSGLVLDLKNEHKVPQDAEWNYLVKVVPLNKEYAGAWLYLDGPIVAHSSGRTPSYRKFVYVSADWQDEYIFDNIGDLYVYLRDRFPLFRRCPYSRVAGSTLRFEAGQVGIVDLSSWKTHE